MDCYTYMKYHYAFAFWSTNRNTPRVKHSVRRAPFTPSTEPLDGGGIVRTRLRTQKDVDEDIAEFKLKIAAQSLLKAKLLAKAIEFEQYLEQPCFSTRSRESKEKALNKKLWDASAAEQAYLSYKEQLAKYLKGVEEEKRWRKTGW